MRRIALASCAELPGWEVDDRPLQLALGALGAAVQTPPWDADLDWRQYDAVIPRTTWDYMERREQFVTWARHVASVSQLFNPAEVIAWNTDKRYLLDLERAGVPIAPTVWARPGERLDVAAQMRARGWRRGFLKPAVGATARETLRFNADRAGIAIAQQHLDRMTKTETMMLQPYLERVETEGELSGVFFDGQLSHCVRKIPVPGDYRVQDDFGAADRPDTLDDDAKALCEKALAAVPTSQQPLLYARVDMLWDDAGRLLLTELEVTEPSLFFRHSPMAGRRLAEALWRRLDAG